MQDAIEEVSGAVAGKGPASSVRAVSAGGEAKNEQSRLGIAESGNGFGPIIPVEVGAAFDVSDLLAVFDESCTASASSDLVVEYGQAVYFLRR